MANEIGAVAGIETGTSKGREWQVVIFPESFLQENIANLSEEQLRAPHAVNVVAPQTLIADVEALADKQGETFNQLARKLVGIKLFVDTQTDKEPEAIVRVGSEPIPIYFKTSRSKHSVQKILELPEWQYKLIRSRVNNLTHYVRSSLEFGLGVIRRAERNEVPGYPDALPISVGSKNYLFTR
jgi:hypothetical protein